MPCAIVALLSFCLSFLCFGLSVRTRSRPYGLCHCPYILAHIKGFGSPYLHVYTCLLLCFMIVLASLVLGFAMLDALNGFVFMWLHLTLMRPCLDVTIWDALPWCRLLRAYFSPFSLRAMIFSSYLFVPRAPLDTRQGNAKQIDTMGPPLPSSDTWLSRSSQWDLGYISISMNPQYP